MSQLTLSRIAGRLPAPVVRLAGRHERLRHFARHLVREGPVEIARGPGRGLRIHGGAGINVGYVLGTTEPLVQALLADKLRPGQVVYDIGACVGFFSLIAARLVGPAGVVVAFEPFPDNAAMLMRNAALNAFTNVQVLEMAVADTDGKANLQLGDSRLDGRLGASSARSIEVRVGRIDSLDLPAPDLVKMDAEGAEFEALAGMRNVIRHHEPVILCEVHQYGDRHIAHVREALGETASRYDLRYVEPNVTSDYWAPHVLATPLARVG